MYARLSGGVIAPASATSDRPAIRSSTAAESVAAPVSMPASMIVATPANEHSRAIHDTNR